MPSISKFSMSRALRKPARFPFEPVGSALEICVKDYRRVWIRFRPGVPRMDSGIYQFASVRKRCGWRAIRRRTICAGQHPFPAHPSNECTSESRRTRPAAPHWPGLFESHTRLGHSESKPTDKRVRHVCDNVTTENCCWLQHSSAVSPTSDPDIGVNGRVSNSTCRDQRKKAHPNLRSEVATVAGKKRLEGTPIALTC